MELNEQDFRIEVPLKDRIIMSLVLAVGMMAPLFALRHIGFIKYPDKLIWLNLAFAVGLLGAIRSCRYLLAFRKKGLVLLNSNKILIYTLLNKSKISLTDLTGAHVIFDPISDTKAEVSFLHGALRYRLPCSSWKELALILTENNCRVLINKDKSEKLKTEIERLDNKKAEDNSTLLPPLRVLRPLILWFIGIIGLIILYI